MKWNNFLHWLLCLILSMVTVTYAMAAEDAEYPYRARYLAVPYVETGDFHKRRDKTLVVDVRSSYEYDTLRIKGAINIPVSSATFFDAIRKLRDENPNKEIVFYCNGKTCHKSYEAVQKSRNNKIMNTVAYDAGVFDWVKSYPDESELLGRSPVDPKKLISKDRFKAHSITADKFESMVASDNNIVLDVRDRLQRDGVALFPGIDKVAVLDDKATLDKHIDAARRGKKTLLFYDAAGKQVEWLMYYLEDKEVKDYYFMDGGAEAFFKKLNKQYVK